MTSALDTYVHLFRPGQSASKLTLFLLHGTGDNERSFARLAELMAPDAAVLSIRGNVSERGMNRFFQRQAEGIYDMADLATRTDQLSAFIAAAADGYGIDRNHLIGIGYSNGANILANTLFQDASVVEAAALLHPLIPFEPPDNPGLVGKRILLTGGTRDPICPPDRTRALLAYFERQGAGARLLLHDGGHELVPQEIAAVRTFLDESSARAG